MNLIQKISWYYRNRGLGALITRVLKGREAAGALPLRSNQSAGHVQVPLKPNAVISVDQLLRLQFPSLQPLAVYTAPGPHFRLNLVTDSISKGSLFGGVGTAIILATLMVKRRGGKLRIVTRTQAPDEQGFAQVLECAGIDFPGNVEFVYADITDRKAQLDICDGDRFLTTSWWATASVLGSISPEKVDYLLQEDERMFYPAGDEWIRCNEILSRRDIRFIINTELLYRHLLSTGLDNLSKSGVWFEPAFPENVFGAKDREKKQGPKRRLFFYARPNNLRNLFYRGVEVLDKAVVSGLIDPKEWEIYFVGKDVPRIALGGFLEATRIPVMNWREYGSFISSIDVGFCLMATPHPSYPPLDLIAAGATVVTNKFGLKQDLGRYSDKILCCDTDVDALLAGLEIAIKSARKSGDVNSDSSQLSRSWPSSLAAVIEHLG